MISITLPSLSEQATARAVDNIGATASSPCEIIVVSPAPPHIATITPRVVWIEDQHLAGANAAHELGFRAATGEHVLAWVDDHALKPGWDLEALAKLAELQALSERPAAVGLRHVSGQIGTCFGFYYPYFPLMRRAHIEAVGGWLSREYRIGFADVDLALRVWAAGGRCAWTDQGVVEQLPDDDRKLGHLHQKAHTTPDDLALFLDRWRSSLGAGWPTNHVRDFNVDKVLP